MCVFITCKVLQKSKQHAKKNKKIHKKKTVLTGRRVVELGLLSKELAGSFNYCTSRPQLSNYWKEALTSYRMILKRGMGNGKLKNGKKIKNSQLDFKE